MFKDVLKREQPIVYRILENALMNDQLAHAYMFVGDSGSHIEETATLLVQSLVCDRPGFACEKCDACTRVKDGNYADMIYLDGSVASIKKDDINHVREEFAKTNVEKRGRKVYIISHAENATESALNTLLTFLEEPSTDAIAIFLVENLEVILDTIRSRCQIIKFKKMDKQICFEKIKNDYDPLDSYILSNLVLNEEACREIAESDIYQHALYLFKNFIKMYTDHDYKYRIFLENEGFPKKRKNGKETFDYLLDMIELIGKDKIIDRKINDSWYNEVKAKITDKQALKLISVSCGIRDRNFRGANINLLVDQLIYELEE